MTKRHRDFDWYLTITLAGITGLLICVGVILNILILARGDDFMRHPPPGQSAQLLGAIIMVVVISVFWFWFRMLHDYFQNRPEKHAVAWGWALFMLNIGAALAYFWFVWKPRIRSARAADA